MEVDLSRTARRFLVFTEKALVIYALSDDLTRDSKSLLKLTNTLKHLDQHHAAYGLNVNEWTEVFLHRLNRTLDTAERLCNSVPQWNKKTSVASRKERRVRLILLQVLWCLYEQECDCILENRPVDEDFIVWARFLRVQQFEAELERRKEHFVSQHGLQKSLSELFRIHSVFLSEYLQKCISLHSSTPIRGHHIWGENVERLLHEMCAEDEIFLSFESRKSISNHLSKTELPLSLSSYRLNEVTVLTSKNKASETAFIPSMNETFLDLTGSYVENVFDVLNESRWSVVLGDPGCGKTTLVRWLTLEFASSFLEGESSVVLNKETETDEAIYMVPVRLPILIRVGEFATWIRSHPSNTLVDYIGQHSWFSESYTDNAQAVSVLREFLHHGHTLVLLDGLDEVSDYEERKKITHLIQSFLKENGRHISIDDPKKVIKEWGGSGNELPGEIGGNQVLITSRVVGYHYCPLIGQHLHLFEAQPMQGDDVASFITHYLLSIHEILVQCIEKFTDIKLNEKKMEASLKKKCEKTITTLICAGENIWSHPMLLSLALPLLYVGFDGSETISRIELYEKTVRTALQSFTLSASESLIPSEAIEWILRDLAIHFHNYSSSGLIDWLDLTRLSLVSVTAYYASKTVAVSPNELKALSYKFVDLVTSGEAGFISARGLNAYGFAHLTFQDYFVALTLVQPLFDEAPISPAGMISRLCIHMTKPSYYEPVLLALSWIHSKWAVDDFDAFCLQFMSQYLGPLPIGALVLVDIVNDLFQSRSFHTVFQLFDYCLLRLSLSSDKTYLEYFSRALSETTTPTELIRDLLQQPCHHEPLCRLLLQSLYGIPESWHLPVWLSDSVCSSIEVLYSENENVQTVIDLTQRRVVSAAYRTEQFCPTNKLAVCLLNEHLSEFKVHPIILSVIIALCGGLYNGIEGGNTLFVPAAMHYSTTLSDALIECVKIDSLVGTRGVEFLAAKCEAIISNASLTNVTREVVDAFIALICLRGMQHPVVYETLAHYRALPCALYRLKLVLFHMRLLYCKAKNNNATTAHAENILHVLLQRLYPDVQRAQVTLLGFGDAFARLTSSTSIAFLRSYPSTEALLVNDLSSRMGRYLRVVCNIAVCDTEGDCAQWRQGQHIYQQHRSNPLFPVAFIQPHLQPIFERLIVTGRIHSATEHGNIPFVILLAEVLFFLNDVVRRNIDNVLRPILLLHVLNESLQTCRLESYVHAIIEELKTKPFFKNRVFPDFIFELFELIHKSETTEVLVKREKERIERDTDSSPQREQTTGLQQFASCIGLLRICEPISELNTVFNLVKRVAQSIQNPVLKILTLRHLREIARSWTETSYYCTIQTEIVEEFNRLPDDLSLCIYALLLTASAEGQEDLHLLYKQLFHRLWARLSSEPNDEEEALDQEAVYQATRHLFGGDIPSSFLTRPHLSTILQLNSPLFSDYFQNVDESVNPSSKLLLVQMYLTELSVDAQILSKYTGSCSFPSSNMIPSAEQLGRLWNSLGETFPHQGVVLIDTFLKSNVSVNIEIKFEKLRLCKGFDEVRDRPTIESWLLYHNDKNRCQFALLAVLLLTRSKTAVTLMISGKLERILEESIFSKTDFIRRGARACIQTTHMVHLKWSRSMWYLFLDLWYVLPDDQFEVGEDAKLVGAGFEGFSIDSTEVINVLFELERERLENKAHSQRFKASFFTLVRQCSNDVCIHIENHLRMLLFRDLSTHVDTIYDEYLANLLILVIKKFRDEQWSESMFESLTTTICSCRLPLTQQAVAYALGTEERGRSILIICLKKHCNSLVSSPEEDCAATEKNTLLPNELVVACLFALTKNKIDSPKSPHNDLEACLLVLRDCVLTSPELIRYVLACHLSQTYSWEESFDDVKTRLGVDIHGLYALFVTNTRYLVRGCKLNEWVTKTCELIKEYWEELGTHLVEDLYAHLCVDRPSAAENYVSLIPDLFNIARNLARENFDELSQAMRMSNIDAEYFKERLFKVSKKGTGQEQLICIQLYSLFGEGTSDFVTMCLTACLLDFVDPVDDEDLYNKFLQVTDRDIVENLFVYLDSPSFVQRYLAAKWLVELAALNIVSSLEVYDALGHVLKDPTSSQILCAPRTESGKPFDFCVRCLLLRLTCLRPLNMIKTRPVLSREEVEEDFNLSQEAALHMENISEKSGQKNW